MKLAFSVLLVSLGSILMGARLVVWTHAIVPGNNLASAAALLELVGLVSLLVLQTWHIGVVVGLTCFAAVAALFLEELK